MKVVPTWKKVWETLLYETWTWALNRRNSTTFRPPHPRRQGFRTYGTRDWWVRGLDVMKETDLLSCLILNSGLDAKPLASRIIDTAPWSVSLDIPVTSQRLLQPVDHTALPYKITSFCTKSVLMSFILGLLSKNNDISPNSTHLLILAMKPQHNILEVLTADMKIEICSEVWLCRLVNSYWRVKRIAVSLSAGSNSKRRGKHIMFSSAIGNDVSCDT